MKDVNELFDDSVEIERELIDIGGKIGLVSVSGRDLSLVKKIRELPFDAVARLFCFDHEEIIKWLGDQRLKLNKIAHTFLLHNFINNETGSAVNKSDLFFFFSLNYSYKSYLNQAKKNYLDIEEIYALKERFFDTKELCVLKNGNNYTSEELWDEISKTVDLRQAQADNCK